MSNVLQHNRVYQRHGRLKITRIVGVIRSNGTLVDPADYATRAPGKWMPGYSNRRCIYWTKPTMTAGMTLLFEASTERVTKYKKRGEQ